MGIYSPNRSGSVVTEQVKPDYAYTGSDLSRIMYESACNDMIVFEAMLASDFTEIRGLNEGTLLESEVKKFNKESLKELAGKFSAAMDRLWEKIKGVLRNVMNKVRAYALSDGKAFAKEFNIAMAKYPDYKFNIKTVVGNGLIGIKEPTVDQIESIVANYREGNVNKAEVLMKVLADMAGKKGESMTPKQYRKTVVDGNFHEVELTRDCNEIKNMLGIISNPNEACKGLRETEKKLNEKVKQLKQKFVTIEKDIAGDDGDPSNVIHNISVLANVAEGVISNYTAAATDYVLKDVRLCRKILGTIKAAAKHGNKAADKLDSVSLEENAFFYEAAMAADAEIDTNFDFVPGEKVDEESEKAIEELIADIDAAPAE